MELGNGICGHGDRVREEEPMELRLGHNGVGSRAELI